VSVLDPPRTDRDALLRYLVEFRAGAIYGTFVNETRLATGVPAATTATAWASVS
jgi:hypothetical protein